MAIISMKKVLLVGLNKEKNKLLKTLHRMGCVELSYTEELDNTDARSDNELKDILTTKLSRINFAFAFMKDIRQEAVKLSNKYLKLTSGKEPEITEPDDNTKALIEYKPPKKSLTFGLPSVIYNEFESIIDKEDDLFEVISKIDEINNHMIDMKSDSIRLKSLKEQLFPYLDIDAKFTLFKDTKNVSIMLGTVPNNKLLALDDIKESLPDAIFEIRRSQKLSAVAIVAPISLKEEILTKLIEVDYMASNFNYDMNAQEKYDECENKIQNIYTKRKLLITRALAYEQFLSDLEILYDYYLLELKKAEAENQFRFTESTFVMQGWIPYESEQAVVDKLENSFSVFLEIRDPHDDEIVPTLTHNNSLVSPYEDITNMYSVPNYKEIDPNPFMAVFYFLFFGIMVSDAGYGLILALGAFTLYKIAKPRKGEGKLVLVIAMGGISTFIWGVMFGGWFGIELKPLLFSPLANPIAMLGLSLGLGVFQILFGMGIKAVILFKQKKYLDAICNIFGWYAVFLGIGLVALSSVPNMEIFKTVGLVSAIVGVIGILIGGGLGKKGIGSKIAGGFSNIYSVTGFLSDILSYSRLFGLGLATGVVGMVVNQLAIVIIDLIPYVGIVFAIPVLLIGHTFNIGINTLGAYVHNSRLQYIEFFSRFYTGSGHQFTPFGSKTKYVYIEN